MSINTDKLKQSPDHTSVSEFAKQNEVIVKCEPMENIPPEEIKTEVADELYKEHEIKEEMAIGPVELQGGSVESNGGGNNKMTNPPECGSFVAIKEEPEDVIVKSEQEGVSLVEIEVPALYEGHEVKEEMVIGPVVLQKNACVKDYPDIGTCKTSDRNFHDDTTPSAHTHNMEHDVSTQESNQPFDNKEYNKMSAKVYSQEFKTKVLLKQQAVQESGFSFICDYCKKEYKRKASLIIHIRVHTGEYPFKCSICKEKFHYKCNLNRHLQTHVGANPHVCGVCSKTFSLLCDLKAHQWTHKKVKDKDVFCDICQKQLKRSNLSQHYKIHTGEKPFKCKICDKQFNMKSTLQKHAVTHTGIKGFPCDICDKRFCSKWSLRNHQMKHSGVKPYACGICDKRFSSTRALGYHQAKHTGVKPFPCDICDERFYTKSSLDSHQIKHTDVKPFPCDQCDKWYYTKINLKNHQVKHTGVKPFVCDVCDKQFTCKYNLQNHYIKHSNDKC